MWSCRFPRTSATTPTSTRRFITRQNVGSMFRPDNPLLPELQVGADRLSRARVVDRAERNRGAATVGTDARRRATVRRRSRRAAVSTTSSRSACFIGAGNALGALRSDRRRPKRHVFGLCLRERLVGARHPGVGVSAARTVPREEFRDHVSPWVVTLDALAPFRARAFARAAGDPAPLPYLTRQTNAERRRLRDLSSRCCSRPRRCARRARAPVRVSAGTFTDMYWTVAQLVTHHASNGCNLRPGDLLAQRDGVRSDEGIARLPARAHLARDRAAAIADRRDARVSRGWRRGDASAAIASAPAFARIGLRRVRRGTSGAHALGCT